MNKLRLIKIYELKGKVHPIEFFLLNIVNKFIKKEHKRHIDYYMDDVFYMYEIKGNNDFYITHNLIWLLRNNFKLSDYDIKEIVKYLLEKYLKIKINEVR